MPSRRGERDRFLAMPCSFSYYRRNKKMPTGDALPWVEGKRELLFLFAAENADLGDLFAIRDDKSRYAFLRNVGEPLVLQAARQFVPGFHRLGFLVELALDDLHVLGDGQRLLLALLPFAFH